MLLRILGTDAGGAPSDSFRYWVAGDPARTPADHTWIGNERRTINRQMSDQPGAGFAFRELRDLGNEGSTLTFETSLTFSTALAAWQFRNLFSRSSAADWPHPVEGDVVMRCHAEDGSWVEEYFPSCVLRKPGIVANGRTITLSYTLHFGEIEAYRTGSTDYITDGTDWITNAAGDYIIADILT